MKKILLILFSQLLFTNTWGQEYFQQIYNQSGTGECLFFQFDSNYLLLGMTDESGDNDITVTLLTTNFEVQWSNKIGSTQDDKPFDAILTSKGTFLITGYSGNGSKTLIVELDVNGNILNQFTLGSFHDRLKLVHETTEGDYLFYGELEGLVPGHNKVSVLKTDSNFNIIWKYYYDYESSTDIIGGEMYARRLVELSDGSYLILGNYTELNNASNNRRTRLLKINKEGDLQWVKGFHGGRMDNVMDVVLSQDENLIIVAQSNSFNSDGRSDILIMKSTLEGELMWSKAYSSGISMEVAQLLEDDDENILVAGTISNSIHGGDDILLFMT
ncbi:MAG: hypothetical protein NXI20_19915, partial [bacterium]|nr:hypothetical protein [bacterium]